MIECNTNFTLITILSNQASMIRNICKVIVWLYNKIMTYQAKN